MLKKTKLLKKLLSEKKLLIVPGAFCALVARIIEKVGFPVIYMSGYGTSSAIIGKPDVGFATMNEMVLNAKHIVDSVDIPVISDADTGYGSAIIVTRTVKEFEKAGVAGIHLEDQTLLKKCANVNGTKVISKSEMVGKIKAALDSRTDQDFLIIARTDARSVHGLEEAIERGNIYAEAGADMIFVNVPRNIEELRRIAKEIKAPLMVNIIEGGLTPLVNTKELEEMGYKIVIYPVSSLWIATKSIMELMRELKETGTTANSLDKMLLFRDFNSFIGFPEIYEMEKKYLSD